MTRVEFREWLKKHDMTVPEFAHALGYHHSTVWAWGGPLKGKGFQKIPRKVLLVMDAWDMMNSEVRPHPWDDVKPEDVVITPGITTGDPAAIHTEQQRIKQREDLKRYRQWGPKRRL